mmetsp:Transcript_37993/g.93384  ORF Transcript_37993/g.93384 Transcript_37993/m.93384 type:complete len:154 (+) Transcript_37993:82-543(+)
METIKKWLGLDGLGAAVKKNIIDTQKGIMLKQRELMMSVQVAQARDNLLWISGVGALVAFGGGVNFLKTKSPAGLIPLGPLSVAWAYTYDFAYGTKLQRVAREAGRILEEERAGGPNGGGLRFLPASNNLMISQDEYKAIFALAAINEDKKEG